MNSVQIVLNVIRRWKVVSSISSGECSSLQLECARVLQEAFPINILLPGGEPMMWKGKVMFIWMG